MIKLLRQTTKSKPKPSPAEVGFQFNDKGGVVGLNPNTFARYIAPRLNICYSPQKLLYEYKDGVYNLLEEEALKSRLYRIVNRFVKDSWRESFETAYVKALKNAVYSAQGMNIHKNLLNLENYMLDIETMDCYEHSQEYRSSIRIPVKYDPKAKCPRFNRFLKEVFEDDAQRIAIAEEILGYCLTTETKAQKAFLLYGNGNNGKSVFCDIINLLCGAANVSAVSINELGNPFARLDLVGKTVNLVTETEVRGGSFNTEMFKAIVAGEQIRAEIKGGASVKFKSTVKMVTAMNSLPFAKDQSYGFVRRLLILPFDRRFVGDEIDRQLFEKLEKELAGIFNLALRGLERLRSRNYVFSESSKAEETLQEYQEAISPITAFVDELLVKADKEVRVSNKVIRSLFGEWCLDRGHKKIAEISDARFHTLLKNALHDKLIRFNTEKSGGKRYISGIALNTAGQTILEGMPEYRPSKLTTVTNDEEDGLFEEED